MFENILKKMTQKCQKGDGQMAKNILWRLGQGVAGVTPHLFRPLLSNGNWAVWRTDFTQGFKQDEILPFGMGDAKDFRYHDAEKRWDVYVILSDWFRENRSQAAFSFTDIIEFLIKPHEKFHEDYLFWEKLFLEHAPNEWDFDRGDYPDPFGAGQKWGKGFIASLGALAAGADKAILTQFARVGKRAEDALIQTAGGSGSTGRGWMAATHRFLNRTGHSAKVDWIWIAHRSSISVKGVVPAHVVVQYRQTLDMFKAAGFKGIVLAGGNLLYDETGAITFWSDVQYFLDDMIANYSNIPVHVERWEKDHPGEEAPQAIQMLMLHKRPNLIRRYQARLIAKSTDVGMAVKAEATIKEYLAQGWLDFAYKSPDQTEADVVLLNKDLLALRYQKILVPALVYLKYNVIAISGTRRVPVKVFGIPVGHRDEEYTVTLTGSTFVDEILRLAGAETVEELRESVRNGKGKGAEYAGLSAFELWSIEGNLDETPEALEEFWNMPGVWRNNAEVYAHMKFGDWAYDPGVWPSTSYINEVVRPIRASLGIDDMREGSLPHKNAMAELNAHPDVVAVRSKYYTWTQPRCSVENFVVGALSVMGEVDDPFAKARALAADKQERQNKLVAKEKEEVRIQGELELALGKSK